MFGIGFWVVRVGSGGSGGWFCAVLLGDGRMEDGTGFGLITPIQNFYYSYPTLPTYPFPSLSLPPSLFLPLPPPPPVSCHHLTTTYLTTSPLPVYLCSTHHHLPTYLSSPSLVHPPYSAAWFVHIPLCLSHRSAASAAQQQPARAARSRRRRAQRWRRAHRASCRASALSACSHRCSILCCTNMYYISASRSIFALLFASHLSPQRVITRALLCRFRHNSR